MTAPVEPAPKPFGFVEWFRRGEQARVERCIEGMAGAGAAQLRTHLSWAEYHLPGGEEWFDWLIPKLAGRFDLLPCVHYTPPSLSRTGEASGAPRRLQDYADFIDHVLTRYGEHFTHVELWNEPNNLLDWDWREDGGWLIFSEMIGAAAFWIQKRGWKAVLGGPSPFDPEWLTLMGERGVLGVVSAVGFHGFPGTWDSELATWQGWVPHLAHMRRILDRYNPAAEIWITETGYSTWRNDEIGQIERFLEVLAVPAERVYWYGWQDIPKEIAIQEGVYFDPRHYHLGILDSTGRPKLLAQLLAEGGAARAATMQGLATPAIARPAKPVVILGGAGFIGSNLAESFLGEGRDVVVVDNLSRPGVERNLSWLKGEHGERVHVLLADLRDPAAVGDALRDAGAVFHLAAQVAVTTSLDDPLHDFGVNAGGTLHVLEAMRRAGSAAPLVFASTNKVYGGLEDIAMAEIDDRYVPVDEAIRSHGVGEGRNLDFCTPYGCSKGVADQYVLDYAKSFGLRTAVLRMSCIYGPHQFGTEDQGWVAHFLIRALKGEAISIYGDGKQVRDILHVADAVRAYRAVAARIDVVAGQAFNLGGGPRNAVSLKMVLREIAKLAGRDTALGFGDWRKGDQLYFVSDTRKIEAALGWSATIGWRDGLRDLARWLQAESGRAGEAGTPGPEAAPERRLTA